jgi:FkbM family methyltransferase
MPVYARPGTSDYVTFKEIFIGSGGEYASFIQDVEGPVNYILDLGSNVGYSIAYFLREWKDAKISAVEPFGPNVSMIRKTFATLIDRGQITVRQAFAGAEEGSAALVTGGAGGANEFQKGPSGTLAMDADLGDSPVLPADHILQQDHPTGTIDIVKCDIEGAEEEVFSTCESWIHRVRYLVAELHDGLDETWLQEQINGNGATAYILGVREGYGNAKLVWCRINA